MEAIGPGIEPTWETKGAATTADKVSEFSETSEAEGSSHDQGKPCDVNQDKE